MTRERMPFTFHDATLSPSATTVEPPEPVVVNFAAVAADGAEEVEYERVNARSCRAGSLLLQIE